MPFGNSVNLVSRRDIVRIARRFNVGNVEHNAPSPEGTAESWPLQPHHFSRPFGTRHSWLVRPGVETPGYCRLSLRDSPLTPKAGERRNALLQAQMFHKHRHSERVLLNNRSP
jgi:hypothetical protein